MDKSEVRAVVKEAVQETLVTLGMDAGDPMEMQQDLHFLRRLRQAFGKIASKVGLVTVGVLVTGTLAALWLGIKAMIAK